MNKKGKVNSGVWIFIMVVSLVVIGMFIQSKYLLFSASGNQVVFRTNSVDGDYNKAGTWVAYDLNGDGTLECFVSGQSPPSTTTQLMDKAPVTFIDMYGKEWKFIKGNTPIVLYDQGDHKYGWVNYYYFYTVFNNQVTSSQSNINFWASHNPPVVCEISPNPVTGYEGRESFGSASSVGCTSGSTQTCQASNGCTGSQTCNNNAWGNCFTNLYKCSDGFCKTSCTTQNQQIETNTNVNINQQTQNQNYQQTQSSSSSSSESTNLNSLFGQINWTYIIITLIIVIGLIILLKKK